MYSLKKYNAAGSRSKFYTLENYNKRGFKTFFNKKDAEKSRNVQIILAEYNLAPRVYSEVGRIRIGKKKKHFSEWGYITEIATLLGCGGNDCACGECGDLEEDIYGEINDLVEKIEEIGYYFGDSHIGNIGYVKRNNKNVLVCIDTGPESVSCNSEYLEYSYA